MPDETTVLTCARCDAKFPPIDTQTVEIKTVDGKKEEVVHHAWTHPLYCPKCIEHYRQRLPEDPAGEAKKAAKKTKAGLRKAGMKIW